MQEQLKALRDIAADLLSSKQQNTIDEQTVKEASAKGLLSLLWLRSTNKTVAHQTEELKEETAKAKCSLEQADLALQNLLYESQYYEKEIQSCRSFQSAYSDSVVALQPVAEFWTSADADLIAKAREQPDSQHELMLQRLSHEMRLRRKMAKDLEDLKMAKSSLLQQVGEQEKMLKQLQGNLKVLDESARPLQSVLLGYPSVRHLSRASADLLPTPLYILYSQLAAAKEALGLPINVSVVGPQEEAVALAEQAAAEALELADDPKRLAKKRRLDTVEETYKVHPLTVELELLKQPITSKAPVLLTVKFSYLLHLHLVTACCGNAADHPLLGALFPLDDGSVVPSESILQLDNGTFQLDPSLESKPFKWCQHLAGIDLIPSLPALPSQLQAADQVQLTESLASYRSQQRVVTVVQRLQAVKEAHLQLKALLSSLTKNSLPSNTSNYARLPQTMITAWELLKTANSSVMKPTALEQHAEQHAARLSHGLHGGAAGANVSGTATPVGAHLVGESAGAGDATGMEEGQAGAAGPSNEAMKEALDQLNNGLDEGEIPDLEPQLQDDFDYADHALLSPRTQPPAHNYFAPDRQPGHSPEHGCQRMVAKPPYRLYSCVLRLHPLEVEVHIKLFLEYPLRPPLLLVQQVRELSKDKKVKGRVIEAVNNEKLIMEHEANITAVQVTPPDSAHELLLHQLLHLRLCVDDFVAQHLAESGSASTKDVELAHLLQARQQRRGRDRRPPVAAL